MRDAPLKQGCEELVTPQASVRVNIIETENGFDAISEAWDTLAQSIPTCQMVQTQDWCHLSWIHFGRGPTGRLKVLTAWSGERLVAVWPFRQSRQGLATRIDILGCGIGDISDPLIDPEFDTPETCRMLFEALCGAGDRIELTCLATDTAMAHFVRSTRTPRYEVQFEDYIADPNRWASWEAFLGHYSQKMREGLRRRRRNLKNMGPVIFESVENPAAQAEAIDWLLEQKREWCRRNHFYRDWFFQQASRNFLLESLKIENAIGNVQAFVLRCDGAIIACGFNLIDKTRVSGVLIAHDPKFQPFAPGMMLVEDTLRFAFDGGLTVEMGIGKSEFKERLATQVGQRVTHVFARTPLGMLAMLSGYLANRGSVVRTKYISPPLKALLPRERLSKLKALLAGLRGVPRAE